MTRARRIILRSCSEVSVKVRYSSTEGSIARVKLADGAIIAAGLPEGLKPQGRVTVVVRPEHADLVPHAGTADLHGKLENIVYFGTDTHYYVKLDGGETFIIRQQNSHGGGSGHKVGEAVGVALEPNSAQVVRD